MLFRSIVTGHAGGSIFFWDARTLAQVGSALTDHTEWVNGLAWCDRDTLASASDDNTVRIWRRQAPPTKAPTYKMDPYVTPSESAAPQTQNASPRPPSPAPQGQNASPPAQRSIPRDPSADKVKNLK